MTALLIIAVYIACIIGFMAWDAFVGFPFEFDGYDLPPLVLAAIFWPLSFPFVFFGSIASKLGECKKNRISKEQSKSKLRIAAQKEVDICMQEAEEEVKKILRNAR